MSSPSTLRSAVLALAVTLIPAASQAGVFVSVAIAPPVLPVYTQPLCPGPGYLWTPGYWAYGDAGYFWVPGVWVLPPRVGVLWTPGYWGWSGGLYIWNAGYWGPHVGFYGGVNYGFGFGGVGFVGGRWNGGVFAYNTAVTNVNTTIIHNTYRTTVIENNVRTSFNGGANGLKAQPTSEERTAMREPHVRQTSVQAAHHEAASRDRSQLASVNHGQPANAAMSRPRVAAANANPAGNNAKSAASQNKPVAANRSAGASNPAPVNRPAAEHRPAGGGQPKAHPAPAPHEGHPGGKQR